MVAVDDDDDEDDEEESDAEDEEDAVSAALGVSNGVTREKTADEDSTESEASEDEGAEEEAYGVPMDLGSVRARAQLGVSESFGKMSISPVPGGIHRQFGGRGSS